MRFTAILALILTAFAAPARALDFTPTGAVLTVTYVEPTTNTDGSALDDLAKTTINSRVCPVVGPCVAAFTPFDVPASSPSGGATIGRQITVGITPGQQNNVEVYATATDTSGNVSPDSDHIVKRVDRLSPKAPN